MTDDLCVTDASFGNLVDEAVRDGRLRGLPESFDRSRASSRLIGTGETYAVWTLDDGNSEYALRIPRRPLDEMPKSMDREFEIASQIPAGVGLRAIHFGRTEDSPFQIPYFVAEFAEGATKTIWEPRDFSALVPVLVQLHSLRSWGGEDPDFDSRIDILSGFREAWEWWKLNVPELALQPENIELGKRVEDFIARRNWACEGAETCAIHSDLCATNILFDPEGRPVLIDWEWAENGDRAKDLAYPGGEAYLDPWYAPMSRAEVESFVRQYVESAYTSLDNAERELEYSRVIARRDSWEAWERYTMGLHCLNRGIKENDSFYLNAGKQVHMRLSLLLENDQEGDRIVQ